MIMYILLLVVQHLKELTMIYKAPYSQTSIEIQKVNNRMYISTSFLDYIFFPGFNNVRHKVYYEI